MPTYDYLCKNCGRTYDVFHKVREVVEDVVCPSCSSSKHQRLLSAPNVSTNSTSSAESPCGSCGCANEMCGLNSNSDA